ncbi:uncharacterized protein LOC143193546 [Rhynchophorus ferrugineus]|uniref:Protein grindelwald n=1 Tax=Rhynchophorus ferrugineus TaxID=354439 RepID=A0A834I3G1_RHYFE|nr:hypothetical protein GWI33_015396 [Rhynchophorus ferrugineus]
MVFNSFLLVNVALVSIVISSVDGASAGITLEGVKCGQKSCRLSEYCSNFDKTCQPCSSACDTSSHNYEKILCESQCQDYLHDFRYVTRDDNGNMRATVESLERKVTVTLTLVILVLFILAAVLVFQLYRWKIKKNITWNAIKAKFLKRNNDNETASAPNENKKKDLRLEIPSPTVTGGISPVTVSTSIDRRPAEDSTLDFAYDNPAMTKTNTSF